MLHFLLWHECRKFYCSDAIFYSSHPLGCLYLFCYAPLCLMPHLLWLQHFAERAKEHDKYGGDPEQPHKLHIVTRVKSAMRRPYWEKDMIKYLGLQKVRLCIWLTSTKCFVFSIQYIPPQNCATPMSQTFPIVFRHMFLWFTKTHLLSTANWSLSSTSWGKTSGNTAVSDEQWRREELGSVRAFPSWFRIQPLKTPHGLPSEEEMADTFINSKGELMVRRVLKPAEPKAIES